VAKKLNKQWDTKATSKNQARQEAKQRSGKKIRQTMAGQKIPVFVLVAFWAIF
jgi:hypothetical protein